MSRDEMLVRFACAALTGLQANPDNRNDDEDNVTESFDIAEMMLAEKDRRAAEPKASR